MASPFETEGFLSSVFDKVGTEHIRNENKAWFRLADDLNLIIMRSAITGMERAHGHNWSQETVAVRLLLRTSESFQGTILLTKRGMAGPARALVRTIVEDSLCAGALLDQPDLVIKAIRDDAEASRRASATFIAEHNLTEDPNLQQQVLETVNEIEKRPRINWRAIAKLSPMLPQYLIYQRLSQDAVHTSASSLNRFVNKFPDDKGWGYRIGPASIGQVTATLHRACYAVMPVAIVTTQLLKDMVNNEALRELGDRLQKLPSGDLI